MSAQIIEFPMNRIRPAQQEMRRTVSVSGKSFEQSETGPNRRSMRIARSVVGWLLIFVVSYFFLAGQGKQVSSAEAMSTSSTSSNLTYTYVTVGFGESLWTLAEKYAPGTDPRDFIDEIVALNNLSDSAIEAGTRLALPKN